MVLKGVLFILLIIFSAVALLVTFIFFVIRLASNHPKKWHWLIAAVGSLLILLGSIFLFVRKVVNKASEFGQHLQEQFEQSAMLSAKNNSSDFHYGLLDSNLILKKLRDFEEINGETKAPDEFYVYFGFRDYYRMPLTYPYALHCSDILQNASLFNEGNVVSFNQSDNGEKDCNLDSITAFAFDEKVMIAKQGAETDAEKFIVYNFKTTDQVEFGNKKEALAAAHKLNYSGPDSLISVLNYYRLFNQGQ